MMKSNWAKVTPRRSFIFTPGLRPEMFPKALASGADIVCVELEDGIAPKDKDQARQYTLALFEQSQADDGIERIVRINSIRTQFGVDDLQAILKSNSPPPAIMLPKVQTPDEIVWLHELLGERGHNTRLHIIIETCAGLEAVVDIARASKRIDALFFGGVDMAADLGCNNNWAALMYARSRVVHAAASADVDVIDVPYLDLRDLPGMKKEALLAYQLGFCGKGAIHPSQIPSINKIFTPDEEAVKRAQDIIQKFAEADTGLVVMDGKLIEKPVLREMHQILAIAERAKKPKEKAA